MPLVAAQQLRVGGADGAAMPVHHQLQLVLIHVHYSVSGLGGGLEEEDGEDGHLKLRADPNEGAAHWLDEAVPAELCVDDMIVGIRLKQW